MSSLRIQTQLLLIYSAVLLVGWAIITLAIYCLNRFESISHDILALDSEASAAVGAAADLDRLASTDIDYTLNQRVKDRNEHDRLDLSVQAYLRDALVRNE